MYLVDAAVEVGWIIAWSRADVPADQGQVAPERCARV
jgi:hypothetical protein